MLDLAVVTFCHGAEQEMLCLLNMSEAWRWASRSLSLFLLAGSSVHVVT